MCLAALRFRVQSFGIQLHTTNLVSVSTPTKAPQQQVAPTILGWGGVKRHRCGVH
jgi:hypothetical protein